MNKNKREIEKGCSMNIFCVPYCSWIMLCNHYYWQKGQTHWKFDAL